MVDKRSATTLISHVSRQYAQSGVALVTVLLVVLLLAFAGAMTLKSAQTSLDLTVSTQSDQLLFQASDVPLIHLLRANKTLFNNQMTQLEAMAMPDGPIGSLLQFNIDNKNRISAGLSNNQHNQWIEYVLCYRPTVQTGLYGGGTQHRILSQSGVSGNAQGYCQISNLGENVYTSSRKVVATQVTFTLLDVEQQNNPNSVDSSDTPKSGEPQSNPIDSLSNAIESTDGNVIESNNTALDDELQEVAIRVYVTSILPNMGHARIKDIEKCLRQSITQTKVNAQDQTKTNQIACLDQTRTPYNIQVQDYMYTQNSQDSGKLVPMGWFDYGIQ